MILEVYFETSVSFADNINVVIVCIPHWSSNFRRTSSAAGSRSG